MSGEPSSNLKILDGLLRHHPELIALRSEPGVGPQVASAAPGLARLLIGDGAPGRHPLVRILQETAQQELSILAGLCRGHVLRTLTTTVSIVLYLAQLFRQRGDEDEQDGEDEGEGSGSVEDAADALDGSSMVQQAFDKVAEQSKVLDELNQLLPGMGWGFGRGHLERALLSDMERFVELLHRADALKRIADELGRLEKTARSARRKGRRGREEVVGVRLGGSLSEVLPAELALLGDRPTEALFYQRYVERRLLSLEYQGALNDDPDRREGNGPVIACVDTSGSMAGVPEIIAKALILSVMRRVLPRGRRVRLMLFGGPGEFEDRDIGRGPGAMRHFLDFLAMRFHAGTDFDGPLERALDLLAEERYERADVLLITDGYAQASRDVVRRVMNLRKQLGFSVVSVVIGGSPRGVAPFSDRVWTLPATEAGLQRLNISEWSGHFESDGD
ncbi:MAG: VWA domain-containing protein [Myxococcota bacterium]